jgi:hypothetical protein
MTETLMKAILTADGDRNGQPARNWQAVLRRWKVKAKERAAVARMASCGDLKTIRADYTNDPLRGQGGAL